RQKHREQDREVANDLFPPGAAHGCLDETPTAGEDRGVPAGDGVAPGEPVATPSTARHPQPEIAAACRTRPPNSTIFGAPWFPTWGCSTPICPAGEAGR